MQYYDIIGDIHGNARKLVKLLENLNYRYKYGVYQHSSRKVIFVGDYIDRGPEQEQTINIVRNMVQADHALAIMGNHEFNAICYATQHPQTKGKFLRDHSEKNFKQHEAFLKEFPFGSPKHKSVLSWFKTLPIYLDLEHIRIVHACWHQPSIEKLSDTINHDNTLPDEFYFTASSKDHEHYRYIENILKAPEVKLPNNKVFKDKDGNLRDSIRIKWWSQESPTYKNLALTIPHSQRTSLPENLIDTPYIYAGHKPVFFGHYWLTGTPKIQSQKVVCTDYSAGKEGNLVAYRWKGEKTVSSQNFLE